MNLQIVKKVNFIIKAPNNTIYFLSSIKINITPIQSYKYEMKCKNINYCRIIPCLFGNNKVTGFKFCWVDWFG